MTHDREIGEALRSLPTPEPRPQFWPDVRAELDEAAGSQPAVTGRVVSSDPPLPDPQNEVTLMPTQPPNTSNRHRLILVAAAAVVAIVGASIAYINLRDDDNATTQVAADGSSASSTSDPASTPESRPAAGISEDSLANLTYPSTWGVDGEVTLTDGRGEGDSAPGSAATTTVDLHQHAFGDLDGDGIGDAIAVLVTDPGGSGTFYDLYAINGANNAVSEPLELGDRITDLQIAIGTDGSVEAIYTDRDGTPHNLLMSYDAGQLVHVEPSFPLFDPYEDTGCWIAGESDATINYLDDTSTLIACETGDADAVAAATGGSIVDTIDGYTLITIPDRS